MVASTGPRKAGSWLLAFALGCGASHETATDGGRDATSSVDHHASDVGQDHAASHDAASRPYRLATGGVQLLVTGPALGLQITPANVAADSDVVDVHQEYYGLPWDAFLAGQPPPSAWVAIMHALSMSAKGTGKPVFLSVSMLDGTRTTLAPRVVVTDAGVAEAETFASRCYDFAADPMGSAYGAAYLAYVAWMVDEFSPEYLNIAIEVNLFFESCPSATAGVVAVANAAYDAVKARSSTLVVFPSFQIDHLYGYSSATCASDRSSCFDANYAAIMGLKRDRFAMSSYPTVPGVIDTPGELPSDWFSRGASRGNERALIAETGWNSSTITVQTSKGACVNVEPSTEADTAAYLQTVLAAAQSIPIDLVDWWDDRDLVVTQLMTSCACTFNVDWCGALRAFSGPPADGGAPDGSIDTYAEGELVLKAFGAMGLRDYAGDPKPTTFPIWSAAQKIAFTSP
jgi:hypothetical protein